LKENYTFNTVISIIFVIIKIGKDLFVCLGLRRTNTVYVIWRISSFTGVGIPQMPLRELLQAQSAPD
jgi:hypothetical protein